MCPGRFGGDIMSKRKGNEVDQADGTLSDQTSIDQSETVPSEGQPVEKSAGLRQGLAWSAVSAMVIRFGTVALGIFLARLLSPEEFGVYAIALTVQAVLMTLADFGLSTDLIRSPDHRRKAPTVATMGLVTGASLTIIMVLSANGTAELLGSPDAGPVIAVMSLTLLLGGIGVVPYAALQRTFAQKKLFMVSLTDFIVSTIVTITLILAGWGVMALAISRVVAHLCSLVVQFVLAGEKPRFGFDRALVPQVLAFGLPVAGANLLSWVLLSSDKVVISHAAGPVALGFYFLAFNISNWPMSVIGQVVRSVSLPAFSKAVHSRHRVLADALAPTWAFTLLAGLMLALLASPVIEIVYGQKWLAAAPILGILGFFGAIRTLFDMAVAFLLAHGHSSVTLGIQALWLVFLLPTMYYATTVEENTGAAWAHLVVALVVVMPAYCWALSRAGASLRLLWAAVWPPALAAIPAAGITLLITSFIDSPLMSLLAGGVGGCGIYVLLLAHWLRPRIAIAAHLDSDIPEQNSDLQVVEASTS